MARPKLEIKKDRGDIFLEYLSVFLVVVLVGQPILFYSRLEEVIPTHFNANGDADGYGSRGIIFVIAGLGVGLYWMLTYLRKIPHKFNYPTKITEKNAEDQYTTALKMMLYLKTFLMGALVYMTSIIIRNGLGYPTQLGSFFVPLILIGTIGICIWPMIRSKN